ncbi:hypothetical protein B0T18DRAFT_392705 [Schizothecium vesticola]|uniref:Uncharacterized protein n=1 Tax=Schizothecium vesticola TaxID=314040 RepID=A0AA40ER95_9PEZI|nr:hypothetical protein B0T18DRAFT_392705 [Schizothecium vesticola]
MCSSDCFLGLLAILFPPLPVWVKRGICSADSFINILLFILGYIPGLLHAWYIIAQYPDPEPYYQGHADAENGRIYVFVHDPRHPQGGNQRQHPHAIQPKSYASAAAQPPPQGNMNYGTTANAGPSSAPAQQPSKSAAAGPQQQQQGHDNGGEGPSDGVPPPSYAQVVAGDNKVQSQD